MLVGLRRPWMVRVHRRSRAFFQQVFENQGRKWRDIVGVEPGHPPTLDRQGVVIYLLIASYPNLFRPEALQEKFGWGATTAVNDAAASLEA